jgi:carbon-monoxide dehydrogenase large subunit
MLYAAVVRSQYAHARLKKVDVSKAKQLSGVVDIITGEEMRKHVRMTVDEFWAAGGPGKSSLKIAASKATKEFPLAYDKVRFVGEPIAIVVAEDPYVAEDALELVEVEYEPLPPVVDPEKAMKKRAPLVYEDWGDNIYYYHRVRVGNAEKALQESDRVFKRKFVIGRSTGASTETMGCVAQYDPATKQLIVWSSNQMPHVLRFAIAAVLGISENTIRVIAPRIGGGFGIKANTYPHEFFIPYIAMKLGRPVMYMESRREYFLEQQGGMWRTHYVEVGIKNGKIHAWKEKIIQDDGAYLNWAAGYLALPCAQLPGPYKINSIWIDGYSVVTNKCPGGAYRGFGDNQMIYVREHMIDIIAKELGVSPVEFRLRNMIQDNEFPYVSSTGLQYDSGSFVRCMKKALELVGYDEIIKKKEKEPNIGVGIANMIERSSCRNLPLRFDADYDAVVVRVEPTGVITIYSSSVPHGQGHETTMAQIVADIFGVDIKDVRIIWGDTDMCPQGLGTWGSRAMVITGSAIAKASEILIDKMKKIAAKVLEVSEKDIVFEGGKFYPKGVPSSALTIADIATYAYVATGVIPGGDIEKGLQAIYTYEPPNTVRFDEDGKGNFAVNYSNATHAAVVKVDTETGRVEILKYVVVDDCGVAVNPLIVDCQIHGGVCQGIGAALFEEVLYDENGQPLNPSFMDYIVPTIAEMPTDFVVEHIETPSPTTPLGVKGVGEAGNVASLPAVANAVMNAIGKECRILPLTPERVLWIMEGKEVV